MYTVSQLRWGGDGQFTQTVEDSDGNRLPVKIGSIETDVTIPVTVENDVNVTVDSTETVALLTDILTAAQTQGTTQGQETTPILLAILTELRIISSYLAAGLNLPDDSATLRSDPAYSEL